MWYGFGEDYLGQKCLQRLGSEGNGENKKVEMCSNLLANKRKKLVEIQIAIILKPNLLFPKLILKYFIFK